MMTTISNAVSTVFGLVQLVLPEVMMFVCALAGVFLFSGHMLSPAQMEKLMNKLGFRRAPATKKIMDEDEVPSDEELKQQQVQSALAAGKDAEAIKLWRETKLASTHSGMILADIVEAMRREGREEQAIVVELQQLAQQNPAVCEDDTMECLLLALDGSGSSRFVEALAAALEDVEVLTPRLRLVLAGVALRKCEKSGNDKNLTDALEELQKLPSMVNVPSELATKLLCVASLAERLPATTALLMDLNVQWSESALETPMAEARERKVPESALQLYRTAQNLSIPRSAKACEMLLDCLEAANVPAASRVVAQDIAQDPSLEMSPALALSLVRAGVAEDETTLRRVLGR